MGLQRTAGGTLLLTASGALADECCCGTPPDECTWFLSPDTLAFDCLAQNGSFNINVPTGTNCGWEASVTSGGAFVTITAGSSGNTDGTVEFELLENSGVDRTGEITVVTTVASPLGPAGTVIGVFTIEQVECASGGGFVPGAGGGSPPAPGSACSWSVGPSNFLLTCFPQGAFFNVHTQLGCGWEAVVISGGAFITITSGTPGNDAGSVFFTVGANAGFARGGQIEVRTTVLSGYGPIGTVVGIVNIVQTVCPGGGGGAPCSWDATGSWYTGNPCDGESGNFEVITYAGCGWEAIPQDPWITITSGSTGLSTGTIVFDIAPNKTGLERTGYIFVHSTSASVLGPAGQLVGKVSVIEPDCAATLIEPAMRAAQERRARTNIAPTVVYPNRRFDENGLIAGAGEAPPTEAGANFYLTNGNSYSMPPNYFYYYDLINYDAFFAQPFGTRGAQLVNEIRTNINSNLVLNEYENQSIPLIGSLSLTVYNTVSLPVPAVATAADYEDRLIDLRNAIRLLIITFETADAIPVPTTNRKRITSVSLSDADAKACALANYAAVAYATRDDYGTAGADPCVFQATDGSTTNVNGMQALSVSANECFISTGFKLMTNALNIPNYISILDSNIIGRFDSSNATAVAYFAPTSFGSPARLIYALIAAGVTAYTMTPAQVEADISAAVAALNRPTVLRQTWQTSDPIYIMIELGFTTII